MSEGSRPITVIELREEEARAFAPTPGNERLLRVLQRAVGADVLWSGPGGGEHVIRPRGKVGWIPVGDRMAVRITPKVPVRQILQMLEVAFDLPSLRFDNGIVTTIAVEGVYERLALLLAEKVNERVRRGLAQDYIARLDEVGAMRGTIDLPRTLPTLARGGVRLVCDFDEHSWDIEDNRLLLWALHRALAGPLRPAVKERVARAHQALLRSVGLRPYPASAFDGRFYGRLNADYEPMHRICRFIVEASGPDLAEGDARSLPFRLDFPALFETFVARALGRELNLRWCVRPHLKHPVGQPSAFDVDIDIVVLERATGRPVLVIDTKHKTELASTDVYQISFYAHQTGAKRALLLYSREPSPLLKANNGGVEVEARGLDLECDPMCSIASLARVLEGELADAADGRGLPPA